MEILIITAIEKPSVLHGVRVFDGVTAAGSKVLVLQTNESGVAELAGESVEPWRPLWERP